MDTNAAQQMHKAQTRHPSSWLGRSASRWLQRSRGNQLTPRLLPQQALNLTGNEAVTHDEPEADQIRAQMRLPDRQVASPVSWAASKIPVFAPDRLNQSQVQPPIIQPKLFVGEV